MNTKDIRITERVSFSEHVIANVDWCGEDLRIVLMDGARHHFAPWRLLPEALTWAQERCR